MKLTKVHIILVILVAGVFTLEKTKQEDENREAQTFSDGKAIPAANYALGSNGGFTLKNENKYKMPEIVQNLIKRPSAFIDGPSGKYVVDEVPSITQYYDGANKLNSFRVQCRMYVNQNDCLHNAGCGWCGATATCVSGNQAGPLEACSKSTYVFTTAGIPNPQERVIKEHFGGVALTLIQNR